MPRARTKSSKKADTEVNEVIQSLRNYRRDPVGFENIKFNLKCKNSHQKEYTNAIRDNFITICTGPSGVGKSYIAVATALELLKDPKTPYKKLVLMVAPVQTDIEIGFIKGDIDSKLNPFALSYLNNLADMIGGMDKVNKLMAEGFIEVICVAFARGINLKDCVCIAGECQQYSKESFLTIITRPTETAKLIFEGDDYQCDNKGIRKGKEISGLKHALDCLSGMKNIGMVKFDKSMVVRNPAITEILTRWDPDTYGKLSDYVHTDNDKD